MRFAVVNLTGTRIRGAEEPLQYDKVNKTGAQLMLEKPFFDEFFVYKEF